MAAVTDTSDFPEISTQRDGLVHSTGVARKET